MQNLQVSDPFQYFFKKSQYLRQAHREQTLLDLKTLIEQLVMRDMDARILSPALLRALILDLSYVLLRHRTWLHAPLLSEVVIDFLNSEHLIPRSLAAEVVEACLDLLHSPINPAADWDADTYDNEFLEHIFICSILAKSELDLILDIGFGRNMLEVLDASVRFDPGQDDDVFQFAPDLVQRMHQIIQRVLSEHQEAPWILARYQLKNRLQRDPILPKHQLLPEFLDTLLELLLTIGTLGASEEKLQKSFPKEDLEVWLQILLRSELIYLDGHVKAKVPHYALSRSGSECSSARFAFERLQKGLDLKALAPMSASYQAALLQALAATHPTALDTLPNAEIATLKPEAFRILIDLWKKQKSDESLLEFFQQFLHNQPHAWIRAEICQAFPLARQAIGSQQLLESLAFSDPSPMVRQEARKALSRTPLESRRESDDERIPRSNIES